MTIVRTIRAGESKPTTEHTLDDVDLARAWADFMAVAGYVIEIETIGEEVTHDTANDAGTRIGGARLLDRIS